MAKKQKKYYVVWEGEEPGIYETWDECKKQVEGYEGAKYKSFKTKAMAEEAFWSPSEHFIGKEIAESTLSKEELQRIGKPIVDSICVDGACNGVTRMAEYQGVDTATGAVFFKQGPFAEGTNNVMEFLAIVHALAFCKERNLNLPIYSDSKIAINWVKYKNPRSKLEMNSKNMKLFELIDRAVKWLHQNDYKNRILKWETKAWGENPADFGRK